MCIRERPGPIPFADGGLFADGGGFAPDAFVAVVAASAPTRSTVIDVDWPVGAPEPDITDVYGVGPHRAVEVVGVEAGVGQRRRLRVRPPLRSALVVGDVITLETAHVLCRSARDSIGATARSLGRGGTVRLSFVEDIPAT